MCFCKETSIMYRKCSHSIILWIIYWYLPTLSIVQYIYMLSVYCHVKGHLIKLQQLNIVLLNKNKYILLMNNCFQTGFWSIPCVLKCIISIKSVQLKLNVGPNDSAKIGRNCIKQFNQGMRYGCANKDSVVKNSQQLSGAVFLTLKLKPWSGTGRVQGLCYRQHL